MADSLRVYETLKSSLSETQARAVTLAIQQSESEAAQDIKTVLEQHKAYMEQQFALFWRTFATKDELRAQLAETKAELMRWMFIFWVGQVAVTVGMMLAAVRLLK
jgi:hypothetical protein